jgi:hypothetical protein
MRKKEVNSANVKEVGYENGNLHVFFNNGCHVAYLGVPPDLYLEMVDAPSAGSFMHRELKNKYSYSVLQEPDVTVKTRQLEAYKDHTVNMWATDKPELIPDELKKYFVKLEFDPLSERLSNDK